MDAASCGRFELAFKFKLFAIGVSVPSPFQLFLFFCLTILVQLDICLLGPCLILSFVSIVFLL